MSGTPGDQGGYQQNQQWAYNDGQRSVQYHQQTTVMHGGSSMPVPLGSSYPQQPTLQPAPLQHLLTAPQSLFQDPMALHTAAMQQAAQFHATAAQGLHGMLSPMQPMQQAHIMPPAPRYQQPQLQYAPFQEPFVQSPPPQSQQPASSYGPVNVSQAPRQPFQLPAPRTPGHVVGEDFAIEEEVEEVEEDIDDYDARWHAEDNARLQAAERQATNDRMRANEEVTLSTQRAQAATQDQLRRSLEQHDRDRKDRDATDARDRKDREARETQHLAELERRDRDRVAQDTREREHIRRVDERYERERREREGKDVQERKDRKVGQARDRAEMERRDREMADMRQQLDAQRREGQDQERRNRDLVAAAQMASLASTLPPAQVDLSSLHRVVDEIRASSLRSSDVAKLVEETVVRQLHGVARAEDLASATSTVHKALKQFSTGASEADVRRAVTTGIGDVMQQALASREPQQPAAIEARAPYQQMSWENPASAHAPAYTPAPGGKPEYKFEEIPRYTQQHVPASERAKSRVVLPPDIPFGPPQAHTIKTGKTRALLAPEPNASSSQASRDRASVYADDSSALVRKGYANAPSSGQPTAMLMAGALSSLDPSTPNPSKSRSKSRSSIASTNDNSLARVKLQSGSSAEGPTTMLTLDALASLDPGASPSPSKSRSKTRSSVQPSTENALTWTKGPQPPPLVTVADFADMPLMDRFMAGSSRPSGSKSRASGS
ncbi:hypothetical protein LTR53_010956, partial [Teratosphaeriaceae sp. CCFEE 6253]